MASYSIQYLNINFFKQFIVFSGLTAMLCGCEKEVKKSGMPGVVFTKETKERSGFTAGHYANVYRYYWVSKDTSDLKFHVYERKADSTVLLGCDHHKQVDFKILLDSLNNVLPKIGSDVNLKKMESLMFRQALYYPDLNRVLSQEYRIKFGEVTVDYPILNTFLMTSTLTTWLNTFLKPLHKKVKRYSIEKFHLIKKEQYSKFFPHSDSDNDPDFSLHGSGIHVDLEEL